MPETSPECGSAGRVSINAIDPQTGKSSFVLISDRRMHNVATRSMGHAKECAFLVPLTLQHPVGIFEGLKEDADEDPRGAGWYCYCYKPNYSFDENGKQIPPYPPESLAKLGKVWIWVKRRARGELVWL